MSEPFPNEWFGEAWNAIVGYRGVRYWIYRACHRIRRLARMHDTVGGKMTYRNPTRYQITFVND